MEQATPAGGTRTVTDEEMEDYYPDYPEDDEEDAECEAFGGNGCEYMRCPEWGGDGLCFVQMRAGYG